MFCLSLFRSVPTLIAQSKNAESFGSGHRRSARYSVAESYTASKSSALRATLAFVYPTDALTYFYLPLFLTNDGARFSASSPGVLCASFMLPAHWRSIFYIYLFTMAPDNVCMRERHVLVDLQAV